MTAELEDTTQQFDESLFHGEFIEVIHINERYSQPWKAELLVNNSRVSFKLDSGADVTVIPLELFEKLCHLSGELQPSNKVPTLFEMDFFEPSVIGGGGVVHDNFVAISPMIMKFGTGIKLDVFYTLVIKSF